MTIMAQNSCEVIYSGRLGKSKILMANKDGIAFNSKHKVFNLSI
jgi:hypothetical protein